MKSIIIQVVMQALFIGSLLLCRRVLGFEIMIALALGTIMANVMKDD